MLSTRSSLTAAATVSAMAIAGFAAAPMASATTPSGRHTVARTAPTWTAHTKATGNAAASGMSTFRVYLAPHGGLDTLKADVAAVSDPASAQYRHYLSAAQYHQKYDATNAETADVTSWLKASGLTVTATEAHHRYVEAKGTNATIEKAFGTQLKTYRHNGQAVQANTTAVSVPNSIAARVLTVTGLDTTPRIIEHAKGKPIKAPAGFRNARPCSAYYGEKPATTQVDGTTPLPQFDGATVPFSPCGYTGPQYRGAYEGAAASTYSGKGVTVAITDAYASPTIAADADTYAKRNGDPAYTAGQLTQSTPKRFSGQHACDPLGWSGEETLDVEAVHAMAPGANIAYYASASCYDADFLNALQRVVDDNVASLVSNSWSDLEANETPDATAAYEQVFMQGAMQGIGFLFSSGDDGDEVAASGTKQVGYPSSDPYATSVGGTADAIGADNSMLWQTGWGTEKYSLSTDGSAWNPLGYLYGAGGGVSALFPAPDYQAGVVPSSHSSGRAVPDIAMDADPTTGMLVGQTQKFTDGTYYDEYRIGGTSLAAPLLAGLSALRTEKVGARLGFLNPSIYAGAGGATYNDVQGSPADAANIRTDYANGEDASGGYLYSVRTFNQDSSLQTAAGWDDVTGVGSPNTSWVTAP